MLLSLYYFLVLNHHCNVLVVHKGLMVVGSHVEVEMKGDLCIPRMLLNYL